MQKKCITYRCFVQKALLFRTQFSNKLRILKVENEHHPKKIIIFASGTGSNAEVIINHFSQNPAINVSYVLSNNPKARVLTMAESKSVNTLCFTRQQLYKSDFVLHFLQEQSPDLIVLAGFMWMVPLSIVQAFPDKIINIHPALLPKYGGKGMYGHHVHEAVLANGERESGITIHYVNEHYDKGQIIAQFKTAISADDNLERLETKIHQLEHAHYAEVIDQILATKS